MAVKSKNLNLTQDLQNIERLINQTVEYSKMLAGKKEEEMDSDILYRYNMNLLFLSQYVNYYPFIKEVIVFEKPENTEEVKA